MPTFRELLERCWSSTLRLAHTIIKDDVAAEDIALEAFTRAYRRKRRLAASTDPDGWIVSVATKLATEPRRRLRKEIEYRTSAAHTSSGKRLSAEEAHEIIVARARRRAVLQPAVALAVVLSLTAGVIGGPRAVRALANRPRHVASSTAVRPSTPANTSTPTPSPRPTITEPTIPVVLPVLAERTGTRIVLTASDGSAFILDVDSHVLSPLGLAQGEYVSSVVPRASGVFAVAAGTAGARVAFFALSALAKYGRARTVLKTRAATSLRIFASRAADRIWVMQLPVNTSCGECPPRKPSQLWEIDPNGARTSAIRSFASDQILPVLDLGPSGFISNPEQIPGGGPQHVEIVDRSLHVVRRLLRDDGDESGHAIAISSRYLAARYEACKTDGACDYSDLIRVTDIVSGRVTRAFLPVGSNEEMRTDIFGPDQFSFAHRIANTVEITTQPGYIALTDARTGSITRVPNSETTAETQNVGFSPDGKWFFYASVEGELRAYKRGDAGSWSIPYDLPPGFPTYLAAF